MDHLPPAPRPQWRRIRLARYLIDYRNHRFDRMRFDANGTLIDFGLPQGEIDAVIDAGVAFRTSGCPGKEANHFGLRPALRRFSSARHRLLSVQTEPR
jgi:biotin synthase